MRILRNLSIMTALLFAMDSAPSNDVVLMVRTDGPPAIDDVTLTADMIGGAQEALPIAEQNEQTANGASYVDTEVDYAIRELMVASDVSFLGFDCAILPASSSAKMMLDPSSTEQATACSSTEQVDNTANINSTALRPSSLLDGLGSTLAYNLGAAFDVGI